VRTAVSVTDAGVEPTAEVTTMTGATTATNTKADPTKVVPVTRTVTGISEHFTYEFPAASVTFLRMHTQDRVAPVVDDVTLAGTSVEGWYADPVTVQATASDDRNLDRTEMKVDDGPWQTATSVQVSGNGTHTVQVRAVDAAGNVGEIRPVTFGIDTQPPVSNATVDATARTVTVRASDNGQVGVAWIETRIGDSGEWQPYTAPVTVGDAETTVQFRAVDKLGNAEDPGTATVPAKQAPILVGTTTTASAPSTRVKRGTIVPVTVRVTSASGDQPTGTVRLSETVVLTSGQLSSGQVTLSLNTSGLAEGKHTVVVQYLGDSTHKASQTTLTVTVTKGSGK